jgi:hypothetical protein
MRLTVGSLPASVYWRRRALVLGVLLLAVIILWTSCSGPSKSDASKNAAVNATDSPTPTPSPAASILTPTIGGLTSSPTQFTAPPTADPSDSTGANAAATTPCADADLLLTAQPETALAPNGAYIKFFFKIKNVSARPCTRNLGADHQELYLQSGTTKAWSSDVCQPAHGSEVVTMAPNIEHEYSVSWNGLASDNGCTNRKPPGVGKYELFARLDTKISAPATVQLT